MFKIVIFLTGELFPLIQFRPPLAISAPDKAIKLPRTSARVLPEQ